MIPRGSAMPSKTHQHLKHYQNVPMTQEYDIAAVVEVAIFGL